MTADKLTKKSRISGFTIVEVFFVMSLITITAIMTFAYNKKESETAIPNKVREDLLLIEKLVFKYDVLKRKYPCHVHNMSDSNEIKVAREIKMGWPKSPFDTSYFISHTGKEDRPSPDDFYYIGVALKEADASVYDRMYDDNNLETGKFVMEAYPLRHYSHQLTLVTHGSHVHCTE